MIEQSFLCDEIKCNILRTQWHEWNVKMLMWEMILRRLKPFLSERNGTCNADTILQGSYVNSYFEQNIVQLHD